MKLPPITVFLLPLDESTVLSKDANPEVDPHMEIQSQTQPVAETGTSDQGTEDSGYQGKNIMVLLINILLLQDCHLYVCI